MAGPRTIPEFTRRVIRSVYNLSVAAGPEIVGVATGAIGLIARTGPRSGLAVRRVTADARNQRVMVAGVIGAGMAIREHRQPAQCAVTFVALHGRLEMTRRLSRRANPVMTG